jgi:uridine kinase
MSPRSASADEVVAAVAELAARHPDRTVWIGIDGFGASGKSTFAMRVAAALDRVAVVPVDDFGGPRIEEWDWDRFRDQLVGPLLDGRPARYQRWEWKARAGGAWVDVRAGSVVIVEGVSSTRAEAAVPWDLTVWVDAPQEIRLRRAVARDGEAMLPMWLDEWMPSEERYAARERPRERVDLVVDGTAAPLS